MKIGISVIDIAPSEGGAYTFQAGILKSIFTKENKSDFVILDYSSDVKLRYVDGIKIIGLKKKPLSLSGIWNHVAQRLARAVFFREKYQISQSDELNRIIDLEKLTAIWFLTPRAYVVKCPFFITIWDLQHRLQPYFPEVGSDEEWGGREAYYSKILPRATRVVVGTEVLKGEAVHFYSLNPDNILVNPLFAPSLEDLLEDPSIASREQIHTNGYFIYPAQFWPHKNHINLLRAYKNAAKGNKNFPILVFTGSDKGNLDRIISEINSLEIADSVLIAGFVTRPQLNWLYKNACALVFPTYFGPDNLPPLEAFAFGCPVLASSVSGSEEQLRDAALLFDPNDIGDISEALQNIYFDKNLRDQLIYKGFSLVHELTPENYVDITMNEFQKVDIISQNWC